MENGQLALEELQCNTNYDMFLVDLQMPVMNGYEVLTIMKKDPKLKDIPVVVISANNTYDVVS